MRFRPAILLATAMTCLLTACGGGGGSGPGKGDDTAPPRAGGALTMLSIADARGLDPFGATYNALLDEPRMAALYDPLFTVDAATGEVHPHLGQSLSTADGGATWTLTLRPDVRFSDGTPLDAEAVRVNWDMHVRPETASLHRAAATGLRLEVTGPLTLRVTPPTRNVLLDRTIATELTYIAAPSVLAKGPEEYRTHPVGAGPFTLSSWTRGSRMEFAKNPTYWQHDKGLPHLDKLTVAIATDVTQAYNTVRAGGAHLFVSADPSSLDKAEKELNVAAVPTGGGQSLAFNLTRAPFDDPRARRAVALALDPRELADTLGTGFRPAKSVFPGPRPSTTPPPPSPPRTRPRRSACSTNSPPPADPSPSPRWSRRTLKPCGSPSSSRADWPPSTTSPCAPRDWRSAPSSPRSASITTSKPPWTRAGRPTPNRRCTRPSAPRAR